MNSLKRYLLGELRKQVECAGGKRQACERLGVSLPYLCKVLKGKNVSSDKLFEMLVSLGWEKNIREIKDYEEITSEYSLKQHLISCILARMQEMKISKSRLADMLGVSRTRIQQILKGNCSVDKLLEIVGALGGKVKIAVSWN